MEDNLRRFNGDKNTKKDLRAYLISYLEETILKRAYEGKDIKPYAEASKILKDAFEQLDIDYAIPEDKAESKNEAR